MKASELIRMVKEQGRRIEELEAEVKRLRRKIPPTSIDAHPLHHHYPSGLTW